MFSETTALPKTVAAITQLCGILGCATALALVPISGALAQSQPDYGSPLYAPLAPPVDPNYGLPTFGMPGAGMPQQRARALDKPDVAIDPQPLTALPLPNPRSSSAATADMETPLYTTSEDPAATSETSSFSDGTDWRRNTGTAAR